MKWFVRRERQDSVLVGDRALDYTVLRIILQAIDILVYFVVIFQNYDILVEASWVNVSAKLDADFSVDIDATGLMSRRDIQHS
jgi:hypothetical protein